MIISFNPIIFQSQEEGIQAVLANILRELMEEKNSHHFIDIKSINAIFYDEKGKYIFDLNAISTKYLSLSQRTNFRGFINKTSRSITNLHKQHLRHIVIGNDEENKEIHPENAYRIITERSKVIVENGINDWKFIKGLCQKYSSGKSGKTDRRSIYKLLDQAIKDEIIEAENCGGIGEMVKVTKRWIKSDRYQNIFQYKLMAIFDSDKRFLNAETGKTNKSTIEHFKGKTIDTTQGIDYEQNSDLIIWHILYKRQIENYIPLDILFFNIKSITPDHKTELKSKTNDELDFIEYSKDNIGEFNVKEQFPKMLLECVFSPSEIEKRCEHHKVFLAEANELISEIEQILLKIVKII